MTLPHSLRAFGHRDYRLYFLGQGVSQIGTWLQLIATSWLIYRLTESAFWLGLATFALQIPFLVLAPLAAVWVDPLPKRNVLFVTQGIALTQSLVMLGLVTSGRIEPWHLVGANLVLGLVNAFDSPTRQAFLVDMVGGKRDLPNAIALNSGLMNAARFVGPMIGGAVIAAAGETWGFGLNALSYAGVLAALAKIQARPAARAARTESLGERFLAGFRWAYGFAPTRYALLLLATVCFCTQPYQSLMPYFARDVFHGDSRTLGWLVGAAGFGAVFGMGYLATRPSVRGLLTLIPFTAGAAGASLFAFALCRPLWLALLLVFLVGMSIMLTAASINTVLQTIVEDHLRARVAAIYIMSFIGTAPLGALAAGAAAQALGPPAVLAIGGLVSIGAALAYWRRLPEIRLAIRPLYRQLGIVPPEAQ